MDLPIASEMTVGQLVTEKPSRSRVFEALKIDYCCGGNRSLHDACTKRQLDVQSVLELLSKTDVETDRDNDAVDPKTLSLTELADHIERDHHAYLRTELPRLDAMTEKVHRVHGTKDPRLADVRRAFCALRDELTTHMAKEERILFPMIRQMEQTAVLPSSHCGSIANPIQQMEAEHDLAGDALAVIRTATEDFRPPDWACNTYRAMLQGLAQLEHDMHQHIHKENNILFPKAIELETRRNSEHK